MENVSMSAAPVAAKTKVRKSNKVATKPQAVAAPVVAGVKKPSNMARFIEATGKGEQDYIKWATEVGQRMHINKLDALVCAKLEVYTVAHLGNLPTELPEGMPESEVDTYLAEQSVNPCELVRLWKQVKADAESWVSKESILNEWLTGVRKEDFNHYGDPNHAADVSRRWWSKEAAALDGQLAEINSMELLNTDVTFEDAIDFIKAHRPGGYVNPVWSLVKRLEERFKEVTTFRIKDYYAEHLLKMCGMVTAADNDDDLPF
ncbi:hypothetical protein [Persicitalea jodogahamensis]|uniref:Uncharacterized protein n=1 Tax=Persicitalea jodogahamensis TaxID=402147 RepID=A0A8J3D856_9BACT|nr:hypothetical protein [Persicitalea jodogahamensis]GHB64107.1 hypothetical protein GCM10007390_17480 [Persicitalea jodogahamensis]